MKAWVLQLLAILAAITGLGAAPVLRLPRLEGSLTMGGQLEMARESLRVSDFRQRDPGDGVAASEATTAWLAVDENYLHVVFDCRSTRSPVRAHRVRREAMLSDDHVVVLLDTFHDRRRAYAFYVNPLGIQADSIMAEGRPEDFSFDTLWTSEGRLTEDGYRVRISIPFRSLRFHSGGQQLWGIALGRTIQSNNENSWWPYLTRRVEGTLQQLATVEGPERFSANRNVQVIPYALAATGRFLDRPGPSVGRFRGANEVRAGTDAKWVVGRSLTIDVTANPDFSQVESDEPQVTVNRRFEVFFPEKRPFFLENADFFQTPIKLLFTRRIADPAAGLRLTGKLGPWALGALAADDRSPVSRSGDRARFTALRMSRDIFEQSRIGVMWTERRLGDHFNRVVAVDSRLTIGRQWALDLQAAASGTSAGDHKAITGSAYDLHLVRSGRRFNYRLDYVDRSPGFTVESGFDPRADIRHLSNFAGYRARPEAGALLAWGPDFKVEKIWDHRGRLLESTWGPALHWEFRRQTRIGLYHLRTEERFRPLDFPALVSTRSLSYRRSGLLFSTSFVPQLTLESNLEQGGGVDFLTEPDSGPVPASAFNGSFRLILRPLTPLIVDNSLLLSRLADPEDGSSRLLNRIFRSRWSYQVNRELSVRLILQYETLRSGGQAARLKPARRLTADLLVTYLVNPWTAVHAGYTDRIENTALDATREAGVYRTRALAGLSRSVERRFFVKVSYLLRF